MTLNIKPFATIKNKVGHEQLHIMTFRENNISTTCHLRAKKQTNNKTRWSLIWKHLLSMHCVVFFTIDFHSIIRLEDIAIRNILIDILYLFSPSSSDGWTYKCGLHTWFICIGRGLSGEGGAFYYKQIYAIATVLFSVTHAAWPDTRLRTQLL